MGGDVPRVRGEGLKKLRHLDLEYCSVSDTSLELLALGCRRLRTLSLRGVPVTNRGLRQLVFAPELCVVALSGGPGDSPRQRKERQEYLGFFGVSLKLRKLGATDLLCASSR